MTLLTFDSYEQYKDARVAGNSPSSDGLGASCSG